MSFFDELKLDGMKCGINEQNQNQNGNTKDNAKMIQSGRASTGVYNIHY